MSNNIQALIRVRNNNRNNIIVGTNLQLEVRSHPFFFIILFIQFDQNCFITKMIKPPKAPTNIRRIWEAVYNKFGEKYSSHILKRLIKEELRYNFKKACSRPPKYCQPSTKIAKELFWTELLRMIYNKKTIFSVDEWSFTRAVKME